MLFLRGIQSAAKNLFFIFLEECGSFRNRKMRKLFQMIVDSSETLRRRLQGDTKKGIEKYSTPAGGCLPKGTSTLPEEAL